ncbi:hypothetical protein [Arthrobacter oryzae]|uniref:DUF8175 domain-containing protein n=1 Tax=Arthrobacter oryzae TaxID=409290 RepID=A0A3N0BS09_9MICC|nr:hypothetical protein [Arthrobacter oryzae]RNL51832.1 hypothetical protein D7003_14835 [Arthrobacter oryzae]
MSQSTESTTESNPFTKPGFIIAAALVVALIAAAVVIFLLPKGDSNAQPAPAASPESASAAPTKSADAVGKSVCGLPSSTETALGTAPKSKWELVGKMAAPTDPKTFGPGVTDGDGFRSCFANSPTGALYAAANMIALGSSGTQDEFKLAEKFLVPGPGRDAAIKAAKTRTSAAGSGETAQVSGFLIKSYSPTEADVDLAIKLPNGALAHSVLSLRWVAGDWKVKASDDGQIFNGVAQLSDLSGFILWSGV